MRLIVQKFGGTSVKNKERIFNVANIVTNAYKSGNNVIAVVSAQEIQPMTCWKKQVRSTPNASKRELDMLLSTGEQISAALLAMAIESMGYPVISLNGHQAGFQTDSNYSKRVSKRLILKESNGNWTRDGSLSSPVSRESTVMMMLQPLAAAAVIPARSQLQLQ